MAKYILNANNKKERAVNIKVGDYIVFDGKLNEVGDTHLMCVVTRIYGSSFRLTVKYLYKNINHVFVTNIDRETYVRHCDTHEETCLKLRGVLL